MSDRKTELKEKINELKNELYDIEMTEKEKEAYKLIGKCFKSKNNYSCPEKPEDYWYEYYMITDFEYGQLYAENFSVDSYGWCRYKPRDYFSVNVMGEISITKEEYINEREKFISNLIEKMHD